MSVMDENYESPSTRFRVLLRQMHDQHPDLPTRELARTFIMMLEDEEPELIAEYAIESAEAIAAHEFRMQFAHTRQQIFDIVDASYETKTEPTKPTLSERYGKPLSTAKRETLYEKFSQWREYDPETGSHLILKMTRLQLDRSAQYDAARSMRFGLKMMIKERVRDLIPNDTDTAENYVSEERLATIIQVTRQEMASRSFRLKLTSAADVALTAKIN